MRWLLLSVLLLAPCAWAQSPTGVDESDEDRRYIYLYVDDDGQMHFVDRLELVPARFQSRARKTEISTSATDREEALRRQAKKRAASRAEQAKAAAKAEMRARMEARDAEEGGDEEGGEEEGTAPVEKPEEQPADQLAERRAILEELVALEEGWATDPDQPEATLLERLNTLEKRLAELDKAIGPDR